MKLNVCGMAVLDAGAYKSRCLSISGIITAEILRLSSWTLLLSLPHYFKCQEEVEPFLKERIFCFSTLDAVPIEPSCHAMYYGLATCSEHISSTLQLVVRSLSSLGPIA